MDNEQIKKVLSACYSEFCEYIGDSPCGCDACPYSKYNTDDDEHKCKEAYIRNKLDDADLTACKPREDCAGTAFEARTTNYTAEDEKPLTGDFRESEGHI